MSIDHTAYAVEAWGINAVSAFSHPTRHARHADPPDPLARARPRLRHRAAPGADLPLRRPGQSRLALSRPPPPPAERLAARRMEAVGDRPRGQVLLPHRHRPQAARGRKG